MSQLNPYLMFNGEAEEALNFYKNVFNGELGPIGRYGDMQKTPNPETANLVMHGFVAFEGHTIMVSDGSPEMEKRAMGNGMTLAYVTDDAEVTRRVYEAMVADGGTVGMELQETFWSPAFGMVTDKFGVSWQLSTEMKKPE